MKKLASNIFEKEDAELANFMDEKKKENQRLEFVPIDEFVEFLNDIRDVLKACRPILLSKISEFYSQLKLKV